MWRLALLLLIALVVVIPAARPRTADAPLESLAPSDRTTLAPLAATPRPTATPTAAPATSTPSATSSATPEASPTTAASPTATATPTPTAPPESVVDRYLAAAALLEADPAIAAERFAAIAEGSSFLAPFARLRSAEAFSAAMQLEAAADAYSLVATSNTIASSLRVEARFSAATLLADLGATAEALALLAGVAAEPAAGATDRATMHWERARLLRDDGDVTWADAARATLIASPGSSAARAAADALIEAEAEVATLDLAYAYYRGRRNGDARALYESVVEAGAPAGELAVSHFYLGALAERTAERTRALAQYAASIEASPAGPLADDARYWRGRVLEELGDSAAAVAEFDLLLSEYPASRFVEDATTRAAVRVGLGGDPSEAARRFGVLVAIRSGTAAATAARWQQLFAELAGERATPPTLARSFDPSSLAALLQQSGGSWLKALPSGAFVELPSLWSGANLVAQQAETDAWLAARYGAPPPASDELEQLPLLQELLAVEEIDFARLVLRDELNAQTEPHGRVTVARTASVFGVHDIALIAAIRVLGVLSPLERLESPRELERLAYPVPFSGEVEAALATSDVPPLLLYALVRQESAFNPNAGSRAGALGLTQVIVPTGQAIAADLSEPFAVDALFEPATSLRFGAHYLATQIDSFGGNVLAALAAYNGGPGNSAYWLTQLELPGADGFLYAVEFAETRLYLERVLENYAWYRYLYLDLDLPSLPWPAS